MRMIPEPLRGRSLVGRPLRALACIALAQAAVASQDEVFRSDLSQRFDRLVRRLAARDDGMERLLLPYVAWHARDAAAESGFLEVGWWAYEGRGFTSASVLLSSHERPVYELSTWDGARFRALRAALAGGVELEEGLRARGLEAFDALELRLSELVVGEPQVEIRAELPRIGANYNRAYAPSAFGLLVSHKRWSEFLERITDVRPIGVTTVAGRDCLGVLFDRRKGEDDGTYDAPWIAWFDEGDSLLALRVQSYLRRAALESLGLRSELAAAQALHLDGVEWLPFQRWEALEIGEIRAPFRIAVRGRLDHPLCTALPVTFVETPLERASLNEPLPAACTRFDPPPGSLVDDGITGSRYRIVAGGTEWVMGPEEAFGASLQRYLALRGTDPAAPGACELPFQQLSCGPLALALAAQALGRPIDFTRVQRTFGRQALSEASLEDLRAMAHIAELEAFPVQAGLEALRRVTDPCIVHLRTEGEDHDHFALAHLGTDVVHLFSPPDEVEVLGIEEFRGRWSGAALIVSTDAGAAGPATQRSRWRFWLSVAGVLLLVVGFASLGRRVQREVHG